MDIDHITYYGGRQEETIRFYGEVLGFDTKEVDGKVWVKIGKKFILHLSSDKESVTKGKFHFGISISNPSALAESIKGNGVRVFDIVDGNEIDIFKITATLTQFFVRDPAGNILEFLKV